MKRTTETLLRREAQPEEKHANSGIFCFCLNDNSFSDEEDIVCADTSILDLSDEDLVSEHRRGNPAAFPILMNRYVDKRHAILRRAAPEVYSFLKNWEPNIVFFDGFSAALASFDFHHRFSTLVYACVRTAAFHAYRDIAKSGAALPPLSLDEVRGEEGNEWTLHDVCANPSYASDPVRVAASCHFLSDIAALPTNKYDVLTYPVALCLIDGMRPADIVRAMNVTRKRVDTIILKLKNYLWSRKDLELSLRYDFK